MDNGTHFYKVDFQVHTPRDPNWQGAGCDTEDERLAYSKELIAACRRKSLDSIAITDHHDFCFFNYIKDAAAKEIDYEGNQIPPEKQIIVFPGIEITLSSPPCQVILILDADFDTTKFDHILTLLGVNPVPSTQSKLPSIENISPATITGLNNLKQTFDQQDWLRGKYILLPNVTDGGYKTLFRQGFTNHYKEMHCVGGYIDGRYDRMGIGKRNIVEGRQQNNGYQPIAVFQTSDNRDRSHAALGETSTYVKFSKPTAEAIRQACLARESRISLEKPDLPNITLDSIDVTQSKFLGSFAFKLNPQYNSLIGGRGTGKSTILEYLRWALCDQTTGSKDSDETNLIETRRKNLIANTLEEFSGEVRIKFTLNGTPHIIKRSSVTKEIQLKISDSNFQIVDENEVRKIVPIQAYSQKQLSTVGVRSDELNRFIESPIKGDLDNIDYKLSDFKKNIKIQYNSYLRKIEIESEINKLNLELQSQTAQVKTLRSALKGLTDNDQNIISIKPQADNEQLHIEKVRSEISTIKQSIINLLRTIEDLPEKIDPKINVENRDLIEEIFKHRVGLLQSIRKRLNSALEEIDHTADLENTIKQLESKIESFNSKYEDAKNKASSNHAQLVEIQKIEQRFTKLNEEINQRKQNLKELDDPESKLSTLFDEWYHLHQEKIELVKSQSNILFDLSKGLIIASTDGLIDTTTIRESTVGSFQGTRINETKIQNLFDYMNSKESPIQAWRKIVTELKFLAEANKEVDFITQDFKCPILECCDYNETNLQRLIQVLDPDKWLMIATTEINPSPTFKYATNNDMEDYIPFDEASAGQQATALLTVLLNQNGAPLIIDQPEDDIDNRAIEDIIGSIWNAKKRRQLIFSSHNANLVVNGDSELVVCCDYKESESQTHGIIKTKGAIDDHLVKADITSVMEGGAKAFKLRSNKYGF